MTEDNDNIPIASSEFWGCCGLLGCILAVPVFYLISILNGPGPPEMWSLNWWLSFFGGCCLFPVALVVFCAIWNYLYTERKQKAQALVFDKAVASRVPDGFCEQEEIEACIGMTREDVVEALAQHRARARAGDIVISGKMGLLSWFLATEGGTKEV